MRFESVVAAHRVLNILSLPGKPGVELSSLLRESKKNEIVDMGIDDPILNVR